MEKAGIIQSLFEGLLLLSSTQTAAALYLAKQFQSSMQTSFL
jgi:hypothetical protein